MNKIKVGIVGGTGYTGVELLRLLARHPQVQLQVITSRGEAGLPVADLFPSLRGVVPLIFSDPAKVDLSQCDVVFFATPHGVAMAQTPALVAAGVKVIDLAADFRLQDAAEFEHWYKLPHSCTDILSQAVYGLPEVYADAVKQAQVIGNPGCYPTTVLLGLAPLLEQGWLDFSVPIIADAKSGVSGAGRKAEVATLFAEASDNLRAYGVAGHRHHPEILAQLKKLSGNDDVRLIFVPHLIPMIRGMLTTLHVKLNAQGRSQDLQAVYAQRYADAPFVDVMPAGVLPDTRSVRGANVLRLSITRQPDDYVTLVVVQDNLVKGASGQAVQNMNLMFDLPADTGLQVLPLLP